MVVNFDKITKIMKRINLPEEAFLCSLWAEENAGYFDKEDIYLYYGASKLVVYPKYEEFVIKIPYIGYVDEDDVVYGEYDWDCVDPVSYENITDFSNAAYPLYDNFGWDYCRTESEYFILAQQYGIEKMFAQTLYTGTYQHNPIYIQEKCCSLEHSSRKIRESCNVNLDKSIDLVKTYSKGYNTNCYTSLTSLMLKDYSEKDCINLIKFLSDYNIGDLHPGNYGFSEIDGRPILIDYSDFLS